MATLDVEEQLQLALRSRTASALRAPPSFMSMKYFTPVTRITLALLAHTLLLCGCLLAATVHGRRHPSRPSAPGGRRRESGSATPPPVTPDAQSAPIAQRLEVALRQSGALFFSTRPPLLFTSALCISLIGSGAVAVFGLMNHIAALEAEELLGSTTATRHSAPDRRDFAAGATPGAAAMAARLAEVELPFIARQVPMLLLALQHLSITAAFAALVYTRKPTEFALAALLPTFLSTFYQSLRLNGDEPDDVPLWTTHLLFGIAAGLVIAFAAPWVVTECRTTLAQIRAEVDRTLLAHGPLGPLGAAPQPTHPTSAHRHAKLS